MQLRHNHCYQNKLDEERSGVEKPASFLVAETLDHCFVNKYIKTGAGLEELLINNKGIEEQWEYGKIYLIKTKKSERIEFNLRSAWRFYILPDFP